MTSVRVTFKSLLHGGEETVTFPIAGIPIPHDMDGAEAWAKAFNEEIIGYTFIE